MKVVAIEVGDVIVYRDTPIERPPSIAAVSSKIDDLAVAMETRGPIVSNVPTFASPFEWPSSIAEIKQAIDELAKCFKQGNKLIDNMQEFGIRLEAAIEKTLNVLGEIHHEEIKHIYQVKSALDALVLVAQKAFAFLTRWTALSRIAVATLWPLRERNCASLSICSRQEVFGECQSCLGYVSENFKLHWLDYCMLHP